MQETFLGACTEATPRVTLRAPLDPFSPAPASAPAAPLPSSPERAVPLLKICFFIIGFIKDLSSFIALLHAMHAAIPHVYIPCTVEQVMYRRE